MQSMKACRVISGAPRESSSQSSSASACATCGSHSASIALHSRRLILTYSPFSIAPARFGSERCAVSHQRCSSAITRLSLRRRERFSSISLLSIASSPCCQYGMLASSSSELTTVTDCASSRRALARAFVCTRTLCITCVAGQATCEKVLTRPHLAACLLAALSCARRPALPIHFLASSVTPSARCRRRKRPERVEAVNGMSR